MFDRTKPFNVPVVSGVTKRCVLSFPTDEQWCARSRSLVMRDRILSGGRTRSEKNNAMEVDAELFESIRQDKEGPTFDEAEASKAISRLERCEITEVNRIPDGFEIRMEVPGGDVTHRLKIPTQKQVMDYGRKSVDARSQRQMREIRVSLEPSGELWNSLKIGTDGYPEALPDAPDPVPIVHKDVALVEMLAQMSQEQDDPEL